MNHQKALEVYLAKYQATIIKMERAEYKSSKSAYKGWLTRYSKMIKYLMKFLRSQKAEPTNIIKKVVKASIKLINKGVSTLVAIWKSISSKNESNQKSEKVQKCESVQSAESNQRPQSIKSGIRTKTMNKIQSTELVKYMKAVNKERQERKKLLKHWMKLKMNKVAQNPARYI